MVSTSYHCKQYFSMVVRVKVINNLDPCQTRLYFHIISFTWIQFTNPNHNHGEILLAVIGCGNHGVVTISIRARTDLTSSCTSKGTIQLFLSWTGAETHGAKTRRVETRRFPSTRVSAGEMYCMKIFQFSQILSPITDLSSDISSMTHTSYEYNAIPSRYAARYIIWKLNDVMTKYFTLT